MIKGFSYRITDFSDLQDSGSNVRSGFYGSPPARSNAGKLDSLGRGRVGFGASDPSLSAPGGESVLVNGAVFKTVSETVRAGSGRFDSYTPPPAEQM